MSRHQLPDFPWDALVPYAATARRHPAGIIDLSVGTPVDPVAQSIQRALFSVAAEPGYPTTFGTEDLRRTVVAALHRRHGVTGLSSTDVLPTIGSKELVAWLPQLLGWGSSDLVVIPEIAYPTYEIGGLLAGVTVVRSDTPQSSTVVGNFLHTGRVMLWLNSPANPSGQVWDVDHLRTIISWARENNVLVVSDECYLALGWDTDPTSILHSAVNDGRCDGLLAVHSLSKSANLAGYRAGFVAGDSGLIKELLAVRKHAGMIVPRPVQAAMTVALTDDGVLGEQREKYRRRREILRKTLMAKGFFIDHSEAGLYLWATRGEDCWNDVAWFAERGILVAPGSFYGPRGARHVRIALTATDNAVDNVASRL